MYGTTKLQKQPGSLEVYSTTKFIKQQNCYMVQPGPLKVQLGHLCTDHISHLEIYMLAGCFTQVYADLFCHPGMLGCQNVKPLYLIVLVPHQKF